MERRWSLFVGMMLVSSLIAACSSSTATTVTSSGSSSSLVTTTTAGVENQIYEGYGLRFEFASDLELTLSPHSGEILDETSGQASMILDYHYGLLVMWNPNFAAAESDLGEIVQGTLTEMMESAADIEGVSNEIGGLEEARTIGGQRIAYQSWTLTHEGGESFGILGATICDGGDRLVVLQAIDAGNVVPAVARARQDFMMLLESFSC